MFHPIDVMEDVLKLKGFTTMSMKDRAKLLFVLYPFFLAVLIFHLILWIPVLPILVKDKFKKRT